MGGGALYMAHNRNGPKNVGISHKRWSTMQRISSVKLLACQRTGADHNIYAWKVNESHTPINRQKMLILAKICFCGPSSSLGPCCVHASPAIGCNARVYPFILVNPTTPQILPNGWMILCLATRFNLNFEKSYLIVINRKVKIESSKSYRYKNPYIFNKVLYLYKKLRSFENQIVLLTKMVQKSAICTTVMD